MFQLLLAAGLSDAAPQFADFEIGGTSDRDDVAAAVYLPEWNTGDEALSGTSPEKAVLASETDIPPLPAQDGTLRAYLAGHVAGGLDVTPYHGRAPPLSSLS